MFRGGINMELNQYSWVKTVTTALLFSVVLNTAAFAATDDAQTQNHFKASESLIHLVGMDEQMQEAYESALNHTITMMPDTRPVITHRMKQDGCNQDIIERGV